MTRELLLVLFGAAATHAAWAQEPSPAPKFPLCAALNNRILAPRTADRPLPLQQGDPAHGLRPACTVPWSKLNPGNHALAVTDCYQDSLLQLENHAVCDGVSGPLWINSRWVVTSAELEQARADSAICQKLETAAYAGTRDYPLACEPKKKELKVESKAASQPDTPAAESAPSPTPATSAPSPPRPR